MLGPVRVEAALDREAVGYPGTLWYRRKRLSWDAGPGEAVLISGENHDIMGPVLFGMAGRC